MSNILHNESTIRRQKVLEGIDVLLSLFSTVKQQRLFPRKIMTKKTRGQVTVYSIEQMIKAFEEANFEDCRINAYPAFLNEADEKDYDNGIGLNFFTPNILFIDLDQKYFSSKDVFDKALTKILKRITSTWTISDLNSGSSRFDSLEIQRQIIHMEHCANMAIIGSMNVDPGHEVFDPTCNQWIYVS
jgi:hypothetical protein